MGHTHTHSHNHKASGLFRFILATVLLLLFSGVEAVTGWWSGSLALLSDAGHMLSDSLALIIAAFAGWIARKPASDQHSYGLGRAEVVAAGFSSLLMIGITVFIVVEAVGRLHESVTVSGLPVIGVAFLGLLVNLVVAYVLSRGEKDLNVRAALLHVFGDILGSIAAIVAGAVIYFEGWLPIDPILSVFIAVLILISSLRLLRESLLVLMEGVPEYLSLDIIKLELEDLEGIQSVHDLHVWNVSSGTVALSAHVTVDDFSNWASILMRIEQVLSENYHINHVTIQPELPVHDCQGC